MLGTALTTERQQRLRLRSFRGYSSGLGYGSSETSQSCGSVVRIRTQSGSCHRSSVVDLALYALSNAG
jgi:hypothetical protein